MPAQNNVATSNVTNKQKKPLNSDIIELNHRVLNSQSPALRRYEPPDPIFESTTFYILSVLNYFPFQMLPRAGFTHFFEPMGYFLDADHGGGYQFVTTGVSALDSEDLLSGRSSGECD